MFDDSADANDDGGVGDKYNDDDNDKFQSSTSKEQDNDNVEEGNIHGGY
jgi:hypothetical protein